MFKAQTLLCGSPAQERCWPTTCAHSLAMNRRHNNPIVSQMSLPLGRSSHHHHHHQYLCRKSKQFAIGLLEAEIFRVLDCTLVMDANGSHFSRWQRRLTPYEVEKRI